MSLVNINRRTNRLGLANKQKGATLIVVLIILVVIVVVGILAIRVALVSLGVATNSQIAQLNFQSSDTPIQLMDQTDPTTLTNLGNVVGAAMQGNTAQAGSEYIFCYKPIATTGQFAQTINSSVLTYNGSSVTANGVPGFCNLSSDYGSNRPALVTQVAVTIPTDSQSNLAPGSSLPRGINLSDGTQLPKSMTSTQRIRVTSTSMLPSMSTSAVSTVQSNCLSSTSAKISDNLSPDLSAVGTLSDCLKSYNVPFNTQVQEFNYINQLTQVTAPGS